MSEGATAMVVFGAIVIVCSVFAHLYQKRFWFAVLIAACSSVVLFQIAAYLNIGRLDPFFIIAVFATFGISSIGAAIIGLAFYLKRNKVSLGNVTGTSFFLRSEKGNGNNST